MPDSPDSAAKAPQHKPLDDETTAALTLFNTYLVADREQQAHERALRKAEKAKNDAAAAVRKLNDRKAPAAETAEAEARYREAVEALQRLRGGSTPAPDAGNVDTEDDTEDEAAKNGAEDAEGDDDDTPPEDSTSENAEDAASESADDGSSVRVEASVGDEDLAGDEPAGVAG